MTKLHFDPAKSVFQQYIEETQRTRKALLASLSPAQDLARQLRESFSPAQALGGLAEEMKPKWSDSFRSHIDSDALRGVQRTTDLMASYSDEIRAAVNGFNDQYRRALGELVSPTWQHFWKTLKSLPARMQEALLRLANEGWFIDGEMEMPALWDLERALIDRPPEEAEAILVDYFNNQLPEIERRVLTEFPERSAPLQAAFAAHGRGEFFLSIPVFLAQADGICQARTKKALYQNRDKKPQLAELLDEIEAEALDVALLHPLTQPLPISASQSARGPSFSGLNRHAVLHGESSTYGTKANSLRAISLLNTVVALFGEESALRPSAKH